MVSLFTTPFFGIFLSVMVYLIGQWLFKKVMAYLYASLFLSP